MNEKKIVQTIIENIGGKDNVKKATHCVTRLRLYIRDEAKVNVSKLEKELGMTVVKSAGQYQIIIGPALIADVYELFITETGIKSQPVVEEDGEKQGLVNTFIATLASIFQPSLSILAGAGIIKALVALLSAFGVITAGTQTYVVLNALGDTFFMFFPIFIGMYAFKTFGGNPLLGAIIGAILVNPDITAWGMNDTMYVMFEGTIIESAVKAEVFGIPVMLTRYGYYYSVIPIIFISYIGAKIERLCKKIYPKTVHMFMVSSTTIVISVLIGLFLVGPVISIASGLVTTFLLMIKSALPVVYGAVLGGFWQLIVLFGLHWAIVPFSFIEFAEYQAGNVDKMTFIASQMQVTFATIGSVLAVMLKERNQETNKIGIPAFIVGFLGITEPAIYGVTLPRKSPFIMSCIAGAVSGAYIALTNVGTYMIGGSGVLGIPATLDPNVSQITQQTDLFNAIIACAIAFGVAFILTAVSYKRQSKKEEASIDAAQIYAPVEGEQLDIKTIEDKVFASEEIGPSIAIKPISDEVYAPVSGKVVSIFPTKHAIGFKDDNGNEILVHIGINTVELNGAHFDITTTEGAIVKAGELIGTANFNAIEEAGYNTSVIVVSTNNKEVIKAENKSVDKNSVIIKYLGA